MTFWSAGGPNLPALQLFLAKEFLLVRKYNTILSILLIAASAVGIHLSLNFDVRGGNVGDPGAAFWPIMLCGGLILCSVILLVQTALEAKKATTPEAPLIDFATAGVHCVLIIFVIMIAYAVLLHFFGFIPATLVFVAATMLAMGERRPMWILLTTLGITGFIYVLFALVMNVVLPQGVLF